jgi:membrane-bound lytic murein transglycosylase D
MIAPALNFFVSAQMLVAVAALLALALRLCVRRGLLPIAPLAELRVHYTLLTLLGALFFQVLFFPFASGADFRLHPVAHVELGRSAFTPAAPALSTSVIRISNSAARTNGVPLTACALSAIALLLLGAAVVALDYLRLHRLLERAHVIRRVGRVRIAVAEGIVSPLSARTGRFAWVVLPPEFLSGPDFHVAIAHELQHHRARDTVWCHAFAPLRAISLIHPLRSVWAQAVAEAQELACDEVLVNQRRRISALDYSSCLIRAAECAAGKGAGRAYAAAPTLFSSRGLLARRIESMYAKNRTNKNWVAVALALAAGTALAAGAFASSGWVVDSRISGRTMLAMAENARKGTDFPVVVNDMVLKELNRFLGTEKGREYVRKARANLALLKPTLDRQLAEHRVPGELLAVGFVESAFQNLPQSANPSQHGAGVWQFIPGSARVFGLRVDDTVDERLDIERETDAAFRYLAANHERYSDWLLGIMAYNMGERALDAAIQRAGTRDPWKLIALGYENDGGYLAKVMAGLLILKNSETYR